MCGGQTCISLCSCIGGASATRYAEAFDAGGLRPCTHPHTLHPEQQSCHHFITPSRSQVTVPEESQARVYLRSPPDRSLAQLETGVGKLLMLMKAGLARLHTHIHSHQSKYPPLLTQTSSHLFTWHLPSSSSLSMWMNTLGKAASCFLSLSSWAR